MTLNSPTSSSRRNEANQLKLAGVAFGLAFQTLFKLGVMYAVDHPALSRPMQQSLDRLRPFLEGGQPFTFGFMNDRLLLNRTLVTHTNLGPLQGEFTRRQIAAITFQPGVTLEEFKRVVALVTLRPAVIAERGGIKNYLAANPIDAIQIIPGDHEAVDVGPDIESYLRGDEPHRPGPGSSAGGLGFLLQAAHAKSSGGWGGDPREVLHLVDEATRHTLADPEGSLTDLLAALAEVLTGLQLDDLISVLSPDQQSDLSGHPPAVVAARLMEDALAGWSVERMAAAPQGAGSVTVAGEVLEALLRGLRATRTAERLLRKLGQFVQQANLPGELFERIRREVLWSALTPGERQAQLLALEVYTDEDFTRLLRHVHESVMAGKMAEVSELVQHYFDVLAVAPAAPRAEELKRAPQLLDLLAGVPALELMHTLAEPLAREILSETDLDRPCHAEAVNCLSRVAEMAARSDDFEFIHQIAVKLKQSVSRRPEQHADCCGKALAALLAPEALARLIDSYLERRSEARWTKTTVSLLAMIGNAGAEALCRRLDEEPSASNRLPLLRLARNLGPSAVESARKRLSDPRWFVVRNAAYLLGDIGDPELPTHLREALRHPDLRVQQAAIAALLKSNAAGRGEVLASALPHLHAGVLEMALDELTVLKDPGSVDHMYALVVLKRDFKAGILEKAVVALTSVPSDRAADALYKITCDAGQAASIRKAALSGLSAHPSPAALRWVSRLSNL